MRFVRVTGYITEEPVWINTDYIVRIQNGRDEGGKLMITLGSETQTMYTKETPEEIIKAIEDGETPTCSSI